MAHFARVVDGVVDSVHVLANEVIIDEDGVEHEAWGQQFLAELHGYEPGELVQCSYNGTFRGLYPAPGFTYDEDLDAFLAPTVEPVEVIDEVI
jgi:hypothetical protein